jgi:hypothetical protein
MTDPTRPAFDLLSLGKRTRGGPELMFTVESIPVNPAYPNPDDEARHLIGLFMHGESIDNLRRLIDVTPAQVRWLQAVTAHDPLRSRTVRQATAFRRAVREQFERRLADLNTATANSFRQSGGGDQS